MKRVESSLKWLKIVECCDPTATNKVKPHCTILNYFKLLLHRLKQIQKLIIKADGQQQVPVQVAEWLFFKDDLIAGCDGLDFLTQVKHILPANGAVQLLGDDEMIADARLGGHA